MEKRIYTVGYAGRTPQEIKQFLEDNDATLFDVRLSPNSKMPEWRKPSLQALLGKRYYHCLSLGNDNRKGDLGPIDQPVMHDLEKGIFEVLNHPRTVVLMCLEYAQNQCHRGAIARELEKRGYKVSEIPHKPKSEKPPRRPRSGFLFSMT